jgi:small-conductance mechanosensitive channel
VLTILFVLAVLTLGPASASDAGEAGVPPATLRFFNRDIVTFREAYFGIPPAGRATQGTQRIRDVLAKGGPGSIKMITSSEGLNVTIDGVYVFRVIEGDLDAEDGQTFDQVRVVVERRLEDAIAAAQESLRGHAVARAAGVSVAATLAFVLAAWLLVHVRRRLRRWVDAFVSRRLRMRQEERTTFLRRVVRPFGTAIFLALQAVLAEEWLRFAFGQFPFTRPWADQLTGYLAGIAMQVGAAMVEAVPGLLMVVVIASLAQLATRILQAVAQGIEAGRVRFFGIDADVVRPARQLITGLVWLFALAMAYPYLPGSSSEAFKGLSVLVGLMLSLGASGLVTQAAGGFILTFSRTLRAGDWVRVGEIEGAVIHVGFFATKVRTPTDQEVSVPNGLILTSVTKNFSRPAAAEASILETSVTIGYNAPWRQVHAMLLEAARRTEGIERDPPPRVLQAALADFYVQYSLWVRLRDQHRRPAVLSALHANIQDIFNAHGVQIMSPHYLGDPDAPVVVPKERWFEPPASAGEERSGDEASSSRQ